MSICSSSAHFINNQYGWDSVSVWSWLDIVTGLITVPNSLCQCRPRYLYAAFLEPPSMPVFSSQNQVFGISETWLGLIHYIIMHILYFMDRTTMWFGIFWYEHDKTGTFSPHAWSEEILFLIAIDGLVLILANVVFHMARMVHQWWVRFIPELHHYKYSNARLTLGDEICLRRIISPTSPY